MHAENNLSIDHVIAVIQDEIDHPPLHYSRAIMQEDEKERRHGNGDTNKNWGWRVRAGMRREDTQPHTDT